MLVSLALECRRLIYAVSVGLESGDKKYGFWSVCSLKKCQLLLFLLRGLIKAMVQVKLHP